MPSTVLLLGGGHAHLQVLLNPPPHTILLSAEPHTTYSGLLPSIISQLHSPSSATIDLVTLCHRQNVHFIQGMVYDVQPAQNLVYYRNPQGVSQTIRYDVLSVNIGSATRQLPTIGESDGLSMVIYTRPIGNLVEKIAQFEERALERGVTKPRVVVVGGGAAGIELVLAVETRFRKRLGDVDCTLVTREDSFGRFFGKNAAVAINAELRKRQIRYVVDVEVERLNLERGVVEMRDEDLEFDCAIVATGACSHEWVKNSGLTTDADGWICVDEKLRMRGTQNVYAAGDCVDMAVPKAGVYAVRSGLILRDNLLGKDRTFEGTGTFLSLISTGEGSGIGVKWGVVFKGTWVYRMKCYIDERWMNKFRGIDGGGEVAEWKGGVAEGVAVLQGGEDRIMDEFEGGLGVLKRMERDEGFRKGVLEQCKGL